MGTDPSIHFEFIAVLCGIDRQGAQAKQQRCGQKLSIHIPPMVPLITGDTSFSALIG
jgi:hypothetical protein